MTALQLEAERHRVYRRLRDVAGLSHLEASDMADREIEALVASDLDDWDEAEIEADEARWPEEDAVPATCSSEPDAPDGWDYHGQRKADFPEMYAPAATPLAAPADRVG